MIKKPLAKILKYSLDFLRLFVVSALATVVIILTSCGSNKELSVNDFNFDGPLGSDGAVIEKLEKNIFKITLGHAPNQPEWPNKLNVQITGNAKGNDLTLIVEGPPRYSFNEYFQSWSYDMENWNPVHWNAGYQISKERDTLVFPVFQQDKVWIGTQVPISFEQVEEFISGIEASPYVSVNILGKSLGGLNLYRLTIKDPNSVIPEKSRWVHYVTNLHPGEHNAQWRIIAMMEWLLSDKGSDMRTRSICHFVIMMSPDAPHNGWYRVNAQGVDMNRSYFAEGSDKEKQAHESYIFQRDLEMIMQSEAPVTTLWGMHTWGGPVEPLLYPGSEIGTLVGPWTEWRDILQQLAPATLIKPLAVREASGYGGLTWEAGPHLQFGITAILCEGAGALYTKEENKKSGELLMESIAKYYKGTKK